MALLSSSHRDSSTVFSVTKFSTRKKSNHHSQTSVNAAERAGVTDVVPWVPSRCGVEEKMLRNMSGEGHLSSGQSSSSTAGRGVTSPGLDGQESWWISLLSRPAMAFLQRYLPGRPRTTSRSETGAGWFSVGLKTNFVDEETEFLRQLDDMMPLTQHPAPHLTYLRCQHEGASGRQEPRGGSTLTWLTADSLQEIGIQTISEEEMDLNLCQQTQIGYLSSVRTFFSHVLLSSVSSQEIKPPGGGKSGTWWGSFWVGEENKTQAPETTDSFGGWTLGENAGPTDLKEEPCNNGGLQTVQNTAGYTTDHRLTISNHLSCSEAAAACSEAALLTPDQDNGYSSLEEEHFQVCHLSVVKSPSEVQQQPEEEEADSTEISAAVKTEMEEETSEEEEEESMEATVLTNPQCQNKAIAFIMGCPYSDDESSSQSDGESDDDDDDDDAGFDSEGSSDESDSTDDEEDDEEDDEDSDVDSEAERLLSSLCQSVDPYNPRNFTAQLHTVTSSTSSLPRTIPIPTSTPPSSAQSTPASSPPSLPPSTLTSSSPPSGSDFWDDSTSASEVDEAESLRLLSSFSCSLDPYSPLNFQATLRTQKPVKEAGSRTRTTKAKKEASQTPGFLRHNPASPPEYRKEEAEERLDSGFSEPSTSSGCSTSQSCSTTKKVRFCDDVEEFFASCGEEEEEEDRRGPWEELARDRCRFLRRCQEVEQSIAFCLQPQHRHLVYCRLVSVLCVQDA